MNLNVLTTLNIFADNEMNDLLESSLDNVDLIGIGEYLLENEDEDAIKKWLRVNQYIETDTDLESVVPDELYDKLHAKYKAMTGNSVVGTSTSTNNRPSRPHTYPELRGSLDKVHFIYDCQIPEKDSRESLEGWLRKALNKVKSYTKTNSNITIDVIHEYKFDGLSTVFEYKDGHLQYALTRKDTDANLGVIVTHIFPDDYIIPQLEKIISQVDECGVQCEILMTQSNYEKFCKIVPKAPTNRRSAVSMILNRIDTDYNKDWFNYLTVQPLQISMNQNSFDLLSGVYDVPMSVIPTGIDYLSGRQLILLSNDKDKDIIHFTFMGDYLEAFLHWSEGVMNYYNDKKDGLDYPIDGCVFSIVNKDIIEALGRKDNINKYQIAYKFPAGEAKTKIVNIEFPVGPVAGTVTPKAIVEPIVIMGNTITAVSISNFAKLNRLNINIGDEVIIKYDIVPTIFKDQTCKKGNGRYVETPRYCPVCGSELSITDDLSVVRCVNDECSSKITGKIYNYIKKTKIRGIGMSTVEDFVREGILKSIPDLYCIQNYKDTIINMKGYGQTSYDNILKGINSRLTLYPHEIIGSVGIPDVGRSVMEKVCRFIDLYDLIDGDFGTLINPLTSINGIGDKMAGKIIGGIAKYRDVLRGILQYVTIDDYGKAQENEPTEVILFSKAHDKEFEDYLTINRLAKVVGSYSKKVTLLVTDSLDSTSTKIDKARKDNVPIITLKDAYSRFNY